jgi:hypothetical protein
MLPIATLATVALSVGAGPTTGADALLSMVKSELRPGSYLLRDPAAKAKIEDAVQSLEASSATPSWPRDLMVLDGRWRLVYSSSLALPSTLPPVPVPDALFGLLEASPLAPRNVEQRIDVTGRRVVNVVSVAPWPAAPIQLLTMLPGPLGNTLATLQEQVVTLELDHAFSVAGEGGAGGGRRQAAAGSAVELRLERVRRTLTSASEEGAAAGASAEEEPWVDMLNPQVRASVRRSEEGGEGGLLFDLIPKESEYAFPDALGALGAGAGEFDTPYADGTLRISRGAAAGPLDELRIFERIGAPRGVGVYESWQEEEDALAKLEEEGKLDGAWADRWQEGGFEEAEAMDFDGDNNGEPDS